MLTHIFDVSVKIFGRLCKFDVKYYISYISVSVPLFRLSNSSNSTPQIIFYSKSQWCVPTPKGHLTSAKHKSSRSAWPHSRPLQSQLSYSAASLVLIPSLFSKLQYFSSRCAEWQSDRIRAHRVHVSRDGEAYTDAMCSSVPTMHTTPLIAVLPRIHFS
jgi:hypothetical protein